MNKDSYSVSSYIMISSNLWFVYIGMRAIRSWVQMPDRCFRLPDTGGECYEYPRLFEKLHP